MRTRPIVAVLAAGVMFGFTACGDNGSQAQQSEQPPQQQSQQQSQQHQPAAASQADISFAKQMMPHHKQALTMSDMVPNHETSPELADLASTIKQAQQPEIDKLNGWLDEWGANDSAGDDHGEHGDSQGDADSDQHGENQHGGEHQMAGMMTDADMAKLKRANGPKFERMWLEMMIEHHRGAVDMARTELDEGKHPGAREMARGIVDSQRAEINKMRSMLDAS